MEQVKRYMVIVICAVMGIPFFSCKKPPLPISFANLKNTNIIDEKKWDSAYNAVENGKRLSDYVSLCENGVTTKPGIVLYYELGDKIGTTSITYQLINADDGTLVKKWDSPMSTEEVNYNNVINLPHKGKFRVTAIADDEIFAQGEIEFK